MGSEVTVTAAGEQVLAARPRQASGAMALAAMSDEEFASRLDSVHKGLERVRQIQRRLMNEDEDYGVIPGTKKPSLLKPGAEKLCAFYGLVATFEIRTSYGDNETRPFITVEAKCVMHLGAEDGPIVGEGYGSANSWESKHRYRKARRSCPACGSEGQVNKSKYPDRATGDIGWYCRDCKANFASDDPAIVGQELGQVQNPDPADVENTILKMAKKRAFIDGTLTTTATSGLFTQDLEDQQPEAPATAQPASPQPARRPQGQAPEGYDDKPWDGEPPADEPPPDDVDEAAAYAAAGVEPPAREPAPAPSRRRSAPAPAAGTKFPCPHCGKPAGPSKFPKPGQTFYCYGCKHPFAPEANS